MRALVHRRVAVTLAAALVVLTAVAGYGYWSLHRLSDSEGWVAHTHEVTRQLAELQSLLKDAETGQRGYLVTGDRAYLKPYTDAVGAVGGVIDGLEELTADNPRQQERIGRLRPLVTARLALLERGVEAYDRNGPEAAARVVKSNQGRQAMDGVAAVIRAMEAEEHDLLAERAGRASLLRRHGSLSLLVAAGLTVLALAAAGVLFQRHLLARMQAEEEEACRRVVEAAETPSAEQFASGEYGSSEAARAKSSAAP
ncbi:MAG TPA: CHASE3 domain-containing protein [Gemmataceae bacterium]|jgi:CHASE3 domain sensor protein